MFPVPIGKKPDGCEEALRWSPAEITAALPFSLPALREERRLPHARDHWGLRRLSAAQHYATAYLTVSTGAH
jgi:hypothetical protein